MVDEIKSEKVQKNEEKWRNDVMMNLRFGLSFMFIFNLYWRLSVMM